MYGRKYMGVERSTFLIDKAGKVARSWRKVKVPGHAEEVLAAVKALQSAELPASAGRQSVDPLPHCWHNLALTAYNLGNCSG